MPGPFSLKLNPQPAAKRMVTAHIHRLGRFTSRSIVDRHGVADRVGGEIVSDIPEMPCSV